MSTAKDEFHSILEEEELKDAVVLIYANKQVDFYDKSLQICLLLNSDADKGWAGRTCLELLMMQLLQKLLTCIRSRIDNGPFSKHQQSRVKVFLRAWIGSATL